MTQKNPSGNLQNGQPFRPVRLRTGQLSGAQVPQPPETPNEGSPFGRFSVPQNNAFGQQQHIQEDNAELQETGPQVVPQSNDISAFNTLKHQATPMPAIPLTPMPVVSPTPIPQSDLEHDARVYSHSAKLQAFVPQQSYNNGGQQGYATPQQHFHQPTSEIRRNTTNGQASSASTQQQNNLSIPSATQHNPTLSYLLALCVGLTALPLPYVVHLLADQAPRTKDGALLLSLLALVLGLLLLQTVLQFMARAVTSSLQRTQTNSSNATLYQRVLHSPGALQATSTQPILDRLNAVTTAQEALIQSGSSFASASITTLMFVGTLFLVDWRLACATLPVVLLYLWLGSIVARRYKRVTRQVLDGYSHVNDTLVQGITALQTRGTIPFLEHTMQNTLDETAQQSYQRAFVGASIRLTLGVMQCVGGIALLGLSSYLLLIHSITIGQFTAFALLLLILSVPLAALTALMQQHQAVSAAEERVAEIL